MAHGPNLELHVLVNKFVLVNSHAHLFVYVIYFAAFTRQQQSSCNRDHMISKAKNYMWSLQKKITTQQMRM